MRFYFVILVFAVIIFIIFRPWFSNGLLSGGDWIYLFSKSMQEISPFSSWDLTFNGMGWSVLPTFWVQSYSFSTLKLASLISWVLYERIFWFFPIIFVSIASSFVLARFIIKDKLISLISPVIFLLNTYVLLLISGGQVGVAMGYSLAPIVILTFMRAVEKNKISYSILFTFTLSLQMIFDIRFAYISLSANFIYFLLDLYFRKKNIFSGLGLLLKNIAFPLMLAILLHSFWIMPVIFSNSNPVGQYGSAYNTVEGVRFFSFAKLENAIGLLHPNWPENIFGKVGFMKPEFLFLPILAFSSLLFVSKIKDQKSKVYILYFALLGLIGTFWAKGSNEPFGNIYLWMFNHFPGFVMFRDPTKWYTLVAVSYAILVPFSIWKIYEWIKSQPKFQMKSKNQIFNLQNLFLILTILYLLFLIRPALFGQLTGTFQVKNIPQDYVKLEQFLSSQDTFSRTLWVPAPQRFGFYSNSHPAISAQDFYKTTDNSQILKKMRAADGEQLLQEAAVKYVIVPFDPQGEIYLKDRKYDEKTYKKILSEVGKTPYLKKVDDFGKIRVFEVSNSKNHFWTPSQGLSLGYKYITPVEYIVSVRNAKTGDIVIFSENFDSKWRAINLNDKNSFLSSVSYNKRFNSFILRQNGSYALDVYYYPQAYVKIGLFISGITLIVAVGTLILLFKKGKT